MVSYLKDQSISFLPGVLNTSVSLPTSDRFLFLKTYLKVVSREDFGS